jgi:hypothetical protein
MHCYKNIVLWRPILLLYCTYSLWRKFTCVKIPQSEANKSANCWGNFGAKGGVVPPSVFSQLLACSDQIDFFLHDLLLISTRDSTVEDRVVLFVHNYIHRYSVLRLLWRQ